MATFVAAIRTRLGGLIEGSYGSGRTVPAATFRARQYAMDLDDRDRPLIDYERTYELTFRGIDPPPTGSRNARAGQVQDRLRWEMRIGYVVGRNEPALAPSSTVGDGTYQAAEDKALADWARIREALAWPANWGSTSPDLYRIEAGERGTADRIDDNRLDMVYTILTDVAYDPATVWDLG